MKRVPILLLVLTLAACSAFPPGGKSPEGVSGVASTQDENAQKGEKTSCVEFAQRDCLRLDIPSILAGNVPYGSDGTPDHREVLAGLRAGTIKPAGKRSFVIFFWGMDPNVTSAMLAQYERPAPDGKATKFSVTEINPSDAPKFDPAHKPPGVARAFRVTFTGAIASFQIPKWGMGNEMYSLVCPEGASVFPDRVNAQKGLWSLPAFFRDMRDPRYEYATRKPIVWGK